MTGENPQATTINIGRIENLYVGGVSEDTLAQQLSGADRTQLEETGYGPTADPDVIEEKIANLDVVSTKAIIAGEPLSEEQEERIEARVIRSEKEDINATARRNILRKVIMAADYSRGLEGFQTTTDRTPDKPGAVNAKQHKETRKAGILLEKACGVCALRPNCKIAAVGKREKVIDKWLEMHPYKSEKTEPKNNRLKGRRPGSLLPQRATQYRADFSEDLDEDRMAPCDPRDRKVVTLKKAA